MREGDDGSGGEGLCLAQRGVALGDAYVLDVFMGYICIIVIRDTQCSYVLPYSPYTAPWDCGVDVSMRPC